MRLHCLSFFFCVFCTHMYSQDLPSDKNATKETIHLYRNLKRIINKGILFGHQDDLAYGVTWKYEKGRSDVKDVAGDYPATVCLFFRTIFLKNPSSRLFISSFAYFRILRFIR